MNWVVKRFGEYEVVSSPERPKGRAWGPFASGSEAEAKADDLWERAGDAAYESQNEAAFDGRW